MQPIIIENREKIAELCRTHHVRRLSVFGSAVRDDFGPERSDVDLLVAVESVHECLYAPNFFFLLRGFDSVFERQVDLLSEGLIRNPYLRKAIDQDKVDLYAA